MNPNPLSVRVLIVPVIMMLFDYYLSETSTSVSVSKHLKIIHYIRTNSYLVRESLYTIRLFHVYSGRCTQADLERRIHGPSALPTPLPFAGSCFVAGIFFAVFAGRKRARLVGTYLPAAATHVATAGNCRIFAL